MFLKFIKSIKFFYKYIKVKMLCFLFLLVSILFSYPQTDLNLSFLAPSHKGFISVSNLKSIKRYVVKSKEQNVSYKKISKIVDNYGKIGLVFKFIQEGARLYFIGPDGDLVGMDTLYIPYEFDLSRKSEFVHALAFAYQMISSSYDLKLASIGEMYVLVDTAIPYELDAKVSKPYDGVERVDKDFYSQVVDAIKGDGIDAVSFDIKLINTSDLRCMGEAALNFGDLFRGLESDSVVSGIKKELKYFSFSGEFGNREIYDMAQKDQEQVVLADVASVLTVPAIINDIINAFSVDYGNTALLNWLGLGDSNAQIKYLLQKRSYYNEQTSYYTISDTDMYSSVYLKLKHKIASGDEWINDYMQKLLTDLGSLCGGILKRYPKGYYIALKIDQNLNFGIIPRRQPDQDTQIIISGDFLGEFLALNDIEGEEFIKIIRESAGLLATSKKIINSSYSTSVDSYALSVLFSNYAEKDTGLHARGKKYKADIKVNDVDDKYSFLNYIASASDFFSQKYGISLGKAATVYLRIGRNSVIGKNMKIADNYNFILSSDDYKRSKIYIGSNVSISADVDVTVKGAGSVIFADNAVLQKNVNLVVPETSVAYIDTESVSVYPKNQKTILNESFDLLISNLLTVESGKYKKVIDTLYQNVFLTQGNEVSEQNMNFLYTQLSVMLSQREADFFLNTFLSNNTKYNTSANYASSDDKFGLDVYPFFEVDDYVYDVKQNPVSNMLYRYKTVGKGESSTHIIEKYMELSDFEDVVMKVNALMAEANKRQQRKYFTLADFPLRTVFDRAT